MNNNIRFNKIVGTSDQIFALYELLKDRTNNISHKDMPNFYEHKKFVKNNPYKVWYLVYNENKAIGTFYIKYDNSIGLKLSIQESFIVGLIIKYIKFNYKPEQAIALKSLHIFTATWLIKIRVNKSFDRSRIKAYTNIL